MSSKHPESNLSQRHTTFVGGTNEVTNPVALAVLSARDFVEDLCVSNKEVHYGRAHRQMNQAYQVWGKMYDDKLAVRAAYYKLLDTQKVQQTMEEVLASADHPEEHQVQAAAVYRQASQARQEFMTLMNSTSATHTLSRLEHCLSHLVHDALYQEDYDRVEIWRNPAEFVRRQQNRIITYEPSSYYIDRFVEPGVLGPYEFSIKELRPEVAALAVIESVNSDGSSANLLKRTNSFGNVYTELKSKLLGRDIVRDWQSTWDTSSNELKLKPAEPVKLQVTDNITLVITPKMRETEDEYEVMSYSITIELTKPDSLLPTPENLQRQHVLEAYQFFANPAQVLNRVAQLPYRPEPDKLDKSKLYYGGNTIPTLLTTEEAALLYKELRNEYSDYFSTPFPSELTGPRDQHITRVLFWPEYNQETRTGHDIELHIEPVYRHGELLGWQLGVEPGFRLQLQLQARYEYELQTSLAAQWSQALANFPQGLNLDQFQAQVLYQHGSFMRSQLGQSLELSHVKTEIEAFFRRKVPAALRAKVDAAQILLEHKHERNVTLAQLEETEAPLDGPTWMSASFDEESTHKRYIGDALNQPQEAWFTDHKHYTCDAERQPQEPWFRYSFREASSAALSTRTEQPASLLEDIKNLLSHPDFFIQELEKESREAAYRPHFLKGIYGGVVITPAELPQLLSQLKDQYFAPLANHFPEADVVKVWGKPDLEKALPIHLYQTKEHGMYGSPLIITLYPVDEVKFDGKKEVVVCRGWEVRYQLNPLCGVKKSEDRRDGHFMLTPAEIQATDGVKKLQEMSAQLNKVSQLVEFIHQLPPDQLQTTYWLGDDSHDRHIITTEEAKELVTKIQPNYTHRDSSSFPSNSAGWAREGVQRFLPAVLVEKTYQDRVWVVLEPLYEGDDWSPQLKGWRVGFKASYNYAYRENTAVGQKNRQEQLRERINMIKDPEVFSSILDSMYRNHHQAEQWLGSNAQTPYLFSHVELQTMLKELQAQYFIGTPDGHKPQYTQHPSSVLVGRGNNPINIRIEPEYRLHQFMGWKFGRRLLTAGVPAGKS